MKERAYIITFMIALFVGGGILVLGCRELTKDRAEANKAFEKQVNLADVLCVDAKDLATEDQPVKSLDAFKKLPTDKQKELLDRLFKTRIEEVTLDEVQVPALGDPKLGRKPYTVKKYTYYIFYSRDKTDPKKEIRAYAFPIGGAGFQGKIRGFLGVAEDQKTIVGVTFYDNVETPGLGGRIGGTSEEDLQIRKQFFEDKTGKKKKMVINRTTRAMLVDFAMVKKAKIKETNANRRVEAITAATETSNAIGKFIKINIETLYTVLARNGTLKSGVRDDIKAAVAKEKK